MRGHTVIRAEKFDWKKHAKILPDQKPVEFRLWQSYGRRWPSWTSTTTRCGSRACTLLQKHFESSSESSRSTPKGSPASTRRYTRARLERSPPRSLTAPSRSLPPPSLHSRRTRSKRNPRSSTHVKDAKLETKLVNFATLTNMFAKANATNTAEAFEQRQRERRNSAVQAEAEKESKDALFEAARRQEAAFAELDRFAPDFPRRGRRRRRPDNNLVHEFLRASSASPSRAPTQKHGQYDNKASRAALDKASSGCSSTW